MARTTTAPRTRKRTGSTTRRGASTRSTSTRAARSTGTRRSRRPGARGRAAHDPAIQEFLDRFTSTMTAGDGRGVAARFEYPALMVMSQVGEHGGNQLLQDEGSVASFFDQAPEQYHAKGVYETSADVQDVEWLSADLALVRVRFPYLDEDGNDMGDGETSVYVLRKTGEGDFAICAAITLGTDADRAQI